MSLIAMMHKNLSPQRHRDTEINQLALRVSLCLCVSVVNVFKKGLSMTNFVAQAPRLQDDATLQCRRGACATKACT